NSELSRKPSPARSAASSCAAKSSPAPPPARVRPPNSGKKTSPSSDRPERGHETGFRCYHSDGSFGFKPGGGSNRLQGEDRSRACIRKENRRCRFIRAIGG